MSPEGMTPEERDRLTRVESKVDFIISNMTNLPPSTDTIRKLDDIVKAAKDLAIVVEGHDRFIDSLKERMAWISSAFVVIGSGTTFLIQWLLQHISWGSTPHG